VPRSRRTNHVGEYGRLGKFADGFHEIPIGLSVARHHAAEWRDHIEGEQVVEPVEPRHLDGREFQAEKTPSRPQHTKRLLQREIDSRHVADAKGDGVAVEVPVGKGQRFRIAFDKADAVVELLGDRAFAPDMEHVLIDVADGCLKSGARGFRRAKGDVAGAAGHIE